MNKAAAPNEAVALLLLTIASPRDPYCTPIIFAVFELRAFRFHNVRRRHEIVLFFSLHQANSAFKVRFGARYGANRTSGLCSVLKKRGCPRLA